MSSTRMSGKSLSAMLNMRDDSNVDDNVDDFDVTFSQFDDSDYRTDFSASELVSRPLSCNKNKHRIRFLIKSFNNQTYTFTCFIEF